MGGYYKYSVRKIRILCFPLIAVQNSVYFVHRKPPRLDLFGLINRNLNRRFGFFIAMNFTLTMLYGKVFSFSHLI